MRKRVISKCELCCDVKPFVFEGVVCLAFECLTSSRSGLSAIQFLL